MAEIAKAPVENKPKLVVTKSTENLFVTVKRYLPAFRLKDNPDILADASMSIGSFIDKDTNDDVRPLTRLEEDYIMADILGIKAESVDFSRAVKDYFIDLTVEIPAEGARLNISTYRKKLNVKGEEIEVDFPLSPIDYCAYKLVKRCAEKNFKVASSFNEADEALHRYYIEDVEAERVEKNSNYKVKQKAMFKFMELSSGDFAKENESTLRMIYDLSTDVHGDNSTGKKLDDIVRLVDEKLISKDPERFLEIAEDDKLHDKALIIRCNMLGILTKTGNTYFHQNQLLGDMDESIRFLNNPENSGYKTKLEAELQTKMKTVTKTK